MIGFSVWNSKMARRLVSIFVMLAGIPIAVTVLTLAIVGSAQIVTATRSMNRIQETAIGEAGHGFRQQGAEALRQSAAQTQQISMQAIQSMSRQMAKEQEQSLHTTSRDFSALTRENVQSALQQSLFTNHASLNRIRDRMTGLFEESAQSTQRRASGNIEKAMLALNDTLMRERASRLSSKIGDHIGNATNFLTLTAQMPGMSDGEAIVQKATLDSLVRRFPEYLLLTVLDKQGRETAMSAADHVVTSSDLGSHAGADYFQTAIHGKVHLALEPKQTPSSVPTLRIAVPIEVYRGKPVGVLAARVSLEDLWDAIRNARIGLHGFAYIVDQTGSPITMSRPPSGPMLTTTASIEAQENTTATLPWRVVISVPRDEAMQSIRALNSDISDNTHSAIDQMHRQIQTSSAQTTRHLQQEAGKIRIAAGQRMQSHAARVLRRLTDSTNLQTQHELARMRYAIQARSQQTESESDQEMGRTAAIISARLTERVQMHTRQAMHSASRHMTYLSLVIVVISCGIGGLIALFTADRIVRPVVRLAQATYAIASGDLERRVDEKAPDEIGDLAAAFNTMANSLQKSRSDLNEAESQLVQSAKLASLGTLSAGIAHELNQPVAIIRGLAQQLQDAPDFPEDVRTDLKIIEGQTGRMTKIIKHLRTFSRTGGAEFSPVDVHRAAQDCFLLIGEQLRTHNIEVVFDLCDGAPEVMADANELEQVFLNLISNTSDALDGRPDARIIIRSHRESDRLILEFRDNGPGIPADVAKHVFDPFFTTKEPGKGTGLGLSISHTIIGRHQGEIRVHNDGGAVFTITLPLAECRVEAPRIAA